MIDDLDKKIIRLIQGDLPLCERPFATLAKETGIPEGLFLDRVKRLKEKKIIRRFGATLRHQQAGYPSNAMVAWVVPDERMDAVGKHLASFREVTHCYQRTPQSTWVYNLYTMIHSDSRKQCHNIAKYMAKTVGVDDYILLFSEKEFRKTSMAYF